MKRGDSVDTIRESDLSETPGEVPEWGRRLLDPLNRTLSDIQRRTDGGSLFDNVLSDVVSLDFKHGKAQRVALTKLDSANSATVLGTASPVGSVQVKLAARRTADITVEFVDASVTSARVTLLVLSEGDARTATPVKNATTVPVQKLSQRAKTYNVPTGTWVASTVGGFPVLGSDVVVSPAPALPLRLRRAADGRVTLQGTVRMAAFTDGHTLLTLPAGWFSDAQGTAWNLDAVGANYSTWVRVSGTTGAVTLAEYDGATYPVDCTIDLSFFVG